jgi:outer membrane receptor for ferrienterochelin and colicin
VTGAAPAVRSSIDRRSYDITKDLNATTGTVADVLRNVPSLSVDLQGNVSIRGDSNVTIMVDGKPSSLFQGPGRAQSLQSLPADEYERVEVITNPSAAFSPEGTGGIVNLISKKTRKPGRSGSIRANADVTGRWNTALIASQKTDKLTLSLSAGVRRDRSPSDSVESRTIAAEPDTPASSSLATSVLADNRDSWNARIGADYDPDAATRVSAALQYLGVSDRTTPDTRTLGYDASDVLDQVFDRTGLARNSFDRISLDSSVKRTFGRDDHDLSVSLSLLRSNLQGDATYNDQSQLPPLPEVFDDRQSNETFTQTDLKADYERPMARQGQLKAGYELKLEDDGQSDLGFSSAASPAGPFDPDQTDAFHFDRWINALYATYEQPIGKFTALAGLRLEATDIRLNDATAAFLAHTDDLHAYPTLHLGYTLSSSQQLLASYGERVQRPTPRDFDPYRIVVSPFTVLMGTPTLKPQETQDFELTWEYRKQNDFVHAGVYYKINAGGVDNAVTDLGDDTFLYTRKNLISSRTGGTEFQASGQLNKTLSYSLSGEVVWSQIDAAPLGLIGSRSSVSGDAHGNLSWQPTPKDTLQLYAWGSGRVLTAEGYETPWALASVGYRHKFDDRLSAFATLQDAFASDRYGTVYTIPELFDRTTTNPHGRTFFLGLAYSFGAGPKHDQPIELGSPAGGP